MNAARSASRTQNASHDVSPEARAREALAWLERHASRATRDGLARYGIPADNALGVAMRDIQALAKRLGRDHTLALALWETGVYEARLLAAYVDEPERVTAAQMERWCRDFDSWAVVDTLCFALFDRTPHAWGKVRQWAGRRGEFVKRAAFALLASLAAHDKTADGTRFLEGLALVEREAGDARNFVKKGVNWALRTIGGKRDPALRKAARETAARLAAGDDATARWIGRDALRQFAKADAKASAKPVAVKKSVAKKTARRPERARKTTAGTDS